MILSRILEHKKAELRHKRSRGYLSELKAKIQDAPSPLGFAVTLEATRTGGSPSLIAEVKKASPSLGLLRPEFSDRFDYLEIAKTYHAHGASALSVLTDKDFFQGSLDYLREIKQSVPLPALNKEFMVDEIQFYEARAYGADAVLLIVAALERQQLIDFYAFARGLSLDVLIETHHERELDRVLERLPEARLIGINNRDLEDLHDRSGGYAAFGKTDSIRQADRQRKRHPPARRCGAVGRSRHPCHARWRIAYSCGRHGSEDP